MMHKYIKLPGERVLAGRKKEKKWIKFRHKLIRIIVWLPFYVCLRIMYRVDIRFFKEQEKRPYLILYNHQTVADQFFVGLAVKGGTYYVASEDIFSNGFISKLLKFAIEPIPIKKQTTDIRAVKTCYRVAKEGGSICIAPEGNRTFSGRTEYMNPAIGSMAKVLSLPIAIFKIQGGYGTQPRWSDGTRKGKMTAGVTRVIKPEEYKDLSADELYQIIRDELYVNEAVADGEFRSGKRAQYLERAMYVCPYCGLSVFESNGNIIRCITCGREMIYGATKEIKGVGFDFPFKFVAEWYDYQQDFVNRLDPDCYLEIPMFTDKMSLIGVILYKNKKVLRKSCTSALYGDRIVFDEDRDEELTLSFDDIAALSVLGRNKANIYHGEQVYQLKGDKHFNALKYVNIYYRYRNARKGQSDGKFLGL
ncbi:MAG: 1-acyl-sn-glycerol-3-phosphate acyltransferase [Lachnospiraceae bacterium]|jgi:1-acyl-sn-glycerol-3-phosphate acyltransferase